MQWCNQAHEVTWAHVPGGASVEKYHCTCTGQGLILHNYTCIVFYSYWSRIKTTLEQGTLATLHFA